MEAEALLLCEIGSAAAACRQWTAILAAHNREAPRVVHERIAGSHGGEVLDRIRRSLSRFRCAVVVIVCDSAHAFLLPALVSGLCTRRIPLVAVLKTRDSNFVGQLLEMGCRECFVPPLREARVWPVVRRLLAETESASGLMEASRPEAWLEGFVGQSPAIAKALGMLPQIAESGCPVLITGETGTGKEVCARGIHRASRRRDKPFVPVNCAGLPYNVFENKLFGHASGAYTIAKKDASGIIAQAKGGVLFLDEVGSLSLQSQSLLLRFLDSREVRSEGSTSVRGGDVRVIAATTADLARLVEQKRFRRDLFQRLDVAHIHLPPLREREGDIQLLAKRFLKQAAPQGQQRERRLSRQAESLLVAHSWPGNVRELKNVIEQAVLLCPMNVAVLEPRHISISTQAGGRSAKTYMEEKRDLRAKFVRTRLLKILQNHGGNITRAALAAGLNRKVYLRLLTKYGIGPHPFPPNPPSASAPSAPRRI